MADASNGANGAPHRHWRSPLAPLEIAIGHHWRHLNGDNGAIKWRCPVQDRHVKEGATMVIHWQSIGDQWRQWITIVAIVANGDNGVNGDNGANGDN